MSASTFTFSAALFALWLLALRCGGRSEQAVATFYILATGLSRITCGPHHACNASFDLAPALVDVALLITLFVLVIEDPRLWLIASASLQLLTLLAYVAQLSEPRLAPMAIFMTRVASSWPALILLGWGIATSTRRNERS